jgi:hypothetical protein
MISCACGVTYRRRICSYYPCAGRHSGGDPVEKGAAYRQADEAALWQCLYLPSQKFHYFSDTVQRTQSGPATRRPRLSIPPGAAQPGFRRRQPWAHRTGPTQKMLVPAMFPRLLLSRPLRPTRPIGSHPGDPTPAFERTNRDGRGECGNARISHAARLVFPYARLPTTRRMCISGQPGVR